MDLQVLKGASIVLLAGLLQGLFALPMKFARRWNHENIWLVFACTGLVIFPWLLTLATIPHVAMLFQVTPGRELLGMFGFGLLWGVGATLTGVGLNLLGIGLGLSIILGLSASIGSLVPLIILSPQKLNTAQGHLFLIGTAVMLGGIALCARAGALRDAMHQSVSTAGAKPPKSSFLAGLLVCIGSGILSSTLNFSYAFGAGVIANARQFGAAPVWASNIVAALATSGGFVANCLYCIFMLRKNQSASRFSQPGTAVNWIYGSAMGALWFGGLALYGLGLSKMGSFGTVTGWSLLMGMLILASNGAGYLTGEWRGAGKRIGLTLGAGMAVVLGALWILAEAQTS
jgi:L-rhamnose-H+ transport protein